MPQQPIRIAPSILAADFARLGEEVAAVAAAGADWVHIDVMDGHFVPNITIGADVVRALKRGCGLHFDVHLMTAPVDRHLQAFAEAGAGTITFHPEAEFHPHRTIQTIRALGCRPGLALNPGTPTAAIEELIGDVDLVLVMTVNPGFGGQAFIESQLDKIARMRALIDVTGRPVDLEVDGGITSETGPRAAAAGADVLVAGTAIFKAGAEGYADAIRRLRG